MGKNRTCDSLLLQGGGFSATPFAKRMPAPIFILGVLGGQFAFLYVDLRLRDLRVLTRSLPVDFATLHPSGCLRQSFSLRSIMSPYGLPAAGSVGSHSSQNVSPYGLLMQPTAQPPCCLVPSQRPLARVQVSGLRFQVSGFRFQVSGFRFFFPPSS